MHMGDKNLNLPPGFRFKPTDEELIVHFLQRKAALLPCHPDVIPDLDLYPYDPWDLDGKAMCEGRKWYFYSRMTQRRITESGHWQTTGAEESIYSSGGQRIGMKRYSGFYIDVPSQSIKTTWIMQEFMLSDSNSSTRSSRRRNSSNIDYGKWVVCQVYDCNEEGEDGDGTELSCLDEAFLSMDDLDEISLPN